MHMPHAECMHVHMHMYVENRRRRIFPERRPTTKLEKIVGAF